VASRLEKYADDIYTCNRSRCGFCREGCPIYRELGFEFNSSRGRMLIARGLLEGAFEPSEALVKRVFQCTLCGYCQYKCALNNISVFEALRADIVALGLEPRETRAMLNSTLKNNNPYLKPKWNRGSWARGLNLSDKGELLYFAGCTLSYMDRRLARNTVNVLTKAGLDVAYLGSKEPCCGSFLHMIGHPDEFAEVARRNVALIKETGCKTVVTSCAGCYETLKEAYTNIIGAQDFEVVHVVELLSDLVDSDKLKLRSPVHGVYTYHDPCHLGRFMGVFEPPRRILGNIKGLKFVELDASRYESHCCGGGGGLLASYPELAFSVAERRVREVEDIGAGGVVSACSICEFTLGRAARYSGSKVKVLDIADLVLKAMRSP